MSSPDSLRMSFRAAIPPALNQHTEDFAFRVDGSPKINHAAIDFEIDLIEMPVGVGLRPVVAKGGRDLRSKMVHPAAHRLIGNNDFAFRLQVLNVTEAQGEPDIKPDRLLDNDGREAVAAIADLVIIDGYG